MSKEDLEILKRELKEELKRELEVEINNNTRKNVWSNYSKNYLDDRLMKQFGGNPKSSRMKSAINTIVINTLKLRRIAQINEEQLEKVKPFIKDILDKMEIKNEENNT